MGLDTYCDPDFDGLKGLIGRHADVALSRADSEAQAALPKVFSRLVTVRKDGTATRRRERMDYWSHNPAAQRLIAHLSDAASDRSPEEKNRLLVVTGTDCESTVEVAHEALLREWATLAGWIEEVGDALRLRAQLESEAQTWDAADRPDHLRWRHERLDPARALLRKADLLEELKRYPATEDFVIAEADWLLAELLCSRTDHARRKTIGMRLSQIGDPRPGIGLREDGVPHILWCDIPAGEVDVNGHGRFEVAPFRIAAYPITYAQYRSFLDAADGYFSDRWWADLVREDEPGAQLRRYINYPADHISWYDATAFCRWLTSRLGYEVRLPMEGEWQWAAQGAHACSAYPWGNDWQDGVANTRKAAIGRTTAVGIYPQGCSQQGVFDLAGNIQEWCADKYLKEGYVHAEEPGMRVLRGGSWDDPEGWARADFRYTVPNQVYRDGQWNLDVSFGGVDGRGPHARRDGYRYLVPQIRDACLGFRISCESNAPSAREKAE